jgi:hypothetical protein
VVAVEVGEDDGGDVADGDARAGQPLGRRARADAGIDQDHAAARPQQRAVPGRSAGEHAEFEGHPCPFPMRGKYGVLVRRGTSRFKRKGTW